MNPKNPSPVFDKPGHHKARPAFLRACGTFLTKRPASAWDGWQLIQHVMGRSKVNVHACKAIDAVFIAIAHFVDLKSGVVQANVTKIAELTGLVTQSKAGNVSITRCSRVIERAIDAGILEGELVWDKKLGYWLPKFINVTDEFWKIAHPEGLAGYLRAREQQFTYQNKGMVDGNDWLTVTQAKEIRRLAHIKYAFEYRKNQQSRAKARRLAKQLNDTEHSKIRAEIGKNILNDVDDLHGLTPESFSSMINQRISLYRKIADDPDPPKH